MDRAELRASIETVGPLLPVFMAGDRFVDGAKRSQICDELGISIPVKQLRTPREICSTLWPLHPERAIQEAYTLRGDPVDRLPLLELATLCGARPASVAIFLEAMKPPRKAPRVRADKPSKAVLFQCFMEPQLKHYAERAALELDSNLSALARTALWEKIVRTLRGDQLPLHAPKWVKTRTARHVARMTARRKDL